MQITHRQQEVFGKLFERSGHCDSIWVAGGAVVDFDKAGDIDLWFGRNNLKLANECLNRFDLRFKGTNEGYDGSKDYTIIGSAFWPAIGKMVQIMVVQPDNPQTAMQSFDISTHKWAYTSREDLVKGGGATEKDEPPKVLLWNSATLPRYIKICQRYGHPIDMEVLKQHAEVAGPAPKKKESVFKKHLYGTLGILS